MELYGGDQGRSSEWIPGAGDTGLEESMWQLGLESGESYPERPGALVCVYYMRTGLCGYGSKCRYNHPRDRVAVAAAARVTGEYPERPGESVCQYYLRTGTCKFGASCKFHHPKHGGGPMSHVLLNIHGYPLRQGEKECFYYLKTGQCKFGITCKYHHPQPAGMSMPSASAPQFYPQVQSPSAPIAEQYVGASTNMRVARPPVLHGSYVQGSYGPMLLPQGLVPIPGWSPYSLPVSPVLSPGAQPAVGGASMYGVTQLSSSMSPLGRTYTSLPTSIGPSSQREQVFPERPREPECQYYLKTGDCKFGSSCRYHHPREWVMPQTNCVLSPLGLPLRPGMEPCTFYLQNGHCKFGSTCKFDHPMGTMRYSPSASSIINMPVAPYPVRSFLAPSSSSPDMRPELMPGSNIDSYSSRIPSSGNTSSSSVVGLILSQTESVSLPGQISQPLGSSRSTRPGG